MTRLSADAINRNLNVVTKIIDRCDTNNRTILADGINYFVALAPIPHIKGFIAMPDSVKEKVVDHISRSNYITVSKVYISWKNASEKYIQQDD